MRLFHALAPAPQMLEVGAHLGAHPLHDPNGKSVGRGTGAADVDEGAERQQRMGGSALDRAAEVARAYPHQLSGGMKQRALIAAALACEPPLLILDEPTTALDVTVEAQILRLLSRLRRDKGIGLLFISHNLGVVRRLCDDVAVMYASQLVELGNVHRVLERPAHPYSKGLLASRPPLAAASRDSRLAAIAGQMPTTAEPDAGCVFAPRCPFYEPRCGAGPQPMTITLDGHRVRCWKADALGSWPRQQVAAAVVPAFRRGDALVNVTQLSKTFETSGGLTTWRLSMAGDPARRS